MYGKSEKREDWLSALTYASILRLKTAVKNLLEGTHQTECQGAMPIFRGRKHLIR